MRAAAAIFQFELAWTLPAGDMTRGCRKLSS